MVFLIIELIFFLVAFSDFFSVFFYLGFGGWSLLDWDEINFAESAREMLATGDYGSVQINYRPFYEKPPLFMLVQAGMMKIFGVGEMAARLPNGVTIHNHYVPAGGDVPDRAQNEKFGQKLDYLTELRDIFAAQKPQRSILVGDLNIAPREDDVWDHKKLLKIVSHTPIEVAHLNEVMSAGNWVDVTRQDIPDGLLYSWWSYRAKDWDAADKGRRLDHVWATSDISAAAHSSRVLRDARGWEKPSDHAPVFASFDL